MATGETSRGLPYVYASTVAAMFSYSALSVVLPFRFQSLGLSVIDYGLALAGFAFGMLATEGLWGIVAFRLATQVRLGALGAVVVGVMVAIGFARTFPEFAITLGLYGAVTVFPIPLARWLAVTARGPGTGGRGSGRFGLFFGVGIAAGAAAGPSIDSVIGFPLLAAFSASVFALSIVFLALLPWARAGLPPNAPGVWRHVSGVFNRPFVIVAVLVSLAFLVFSLVSNFLQYYSVDVFHGTSAQAGYVIGGARAVSVVAGFGLGAVVDRWGPSRCAPFGFAILAAGAALTWASSSYAEMVGATVVFAVGWGWLSATLLPLALEPVAPGSQGAVVGVFGSFEDLGLLVGPIGIAAAYSTWGPPSAFLLVLAVAAGACVSAAVAGRVGAFGRRTGSTVLRPGSRGSGSATGGTEPED